MAANPALFLFVERRGLNPMYLGRWLRLLPQRQREALLAQAHALFWQLPEPVRLALVRRFLAVFAPRF